MSTSPAEVVSTLNRYVFTDSPNVSFLSSINLKSDDIILLTFIFQHNTEHVELHLSSTLDRWAIDNITVSDTALPQSSLDAILSRSHQLQWPLFRTVEECIAILRRFLFNDESTIVHALPWRNTSMAQTVISRHFTTSSAASSSHSVIAPLDLQITLISAALNSSRSCALVNPCPPCFLTDIDKQQEQSLEDTQELLRPQLHQSNRTEQQQLDRIEKAFKSLPRLSTFFTNPSQINQLPSPTISLLAYLLSSHCQFRAIPVQTDLYTFGHTEAHRQAAAIQPTLTLPHYQFELSHPPDPHFDAAVDRSGSIVAFHGSPLKNWYSIVHRGLESKSGTKEQTSGAIFGNGIYFSDDLRVSRMFSDVARGWKYSILGERLEIVGMYTIINNPEGVRRQQETKEKSTTPQQQHHSNTNGHSAGNNNSAVDGDDAPPENYYVVKDNSYIRLHSLLIWRAPLQTAQQQRRSYWLIIAYAIILLVIILSRIDWSFVKKVSQRYATQLPRFL